MDKVQVVIITRNRPETLLVAVKSILNQSYENMELTISDNSTNDDTFHALSPYHDKIKYIRRKPNIDSSMDHISTALREASCKYLIVFHDDDEMLPNMVESLSRALMTHPGYAAAGANAYIVKNNKKKLSFRDGDSVIAGIDQLVDRYNEKGIAPFPSYMYNMELVQGLFMDKRHGHKYCDVAFLADVAARGPIYYVGEPLMYYNIHPEQDSQYLDFIGHVKLTNYLRKRVSNKNVTTGLRLYHIYSNSIVGFKEGSMPYRGSVAKLLFKYSSAEYFPKYIIRLIQSKSHHV